MQCTYPLLKKLLIEVGCESFPQVAKFCLAKKMCQSNLVPVYNSKSVKQKLPKCDSSENLLFFEMLSHTTDTMSSRESLSMSFFLSESLRIHVLNIYEKLIYTLLHMFKIYGIILSI